MTKAFPIFIMKRPAHGHRMDSLVLREVSAQVFMTASTADMDQRMIRALWHKTAAGLPMRWDCQQTGWRPSIRFMAQMS